MSNRAPTHVRREDVDAFDPDYIASLVLLRFGEGADAWLAELADFYRNGIDDQVFGDSYRSVLNRLERVAIAVKRRNRL